MIHILDQWLTDTNEEQHLQYYNSAMKFIAYVNSVGGGGGGGGGGACNLKLWGCLTLGGESLPLPPCPPTSCTYKNDTCSGLIGGGGGGGGLVIDKLTTGIGNAPLIV